MFLCVNYQKEKLRKNKRVTMNFSSATKHFNNHQYSNSSLTFEETIRIQNPLIILQSKNKFDNVLFWGKISTLADDYYIAFGYRKDCLKNQKFFYSQNAIEWILLPTPQDHLKKVCVLSGRMFTGDPGHEIEIQSDPQFEKRNEKLLQLSESNTVKLREEQRLACVVKMITEEAALVPRGAIYLRTDGLITLNKYFSGLKREDACLLSSYQMFREPRQKFNFNLLKRNRFNYTTDFLDTVDDLIPLNESFSINLENNNQVVVFKSLHWPGMICYHQVNSNCYGFIYIGNGKKNLDVLLM